MPISSNHQTPAELWVAVRAAANRRSMRASTESPPTGENANRYTRVGDVFIRYSADGSSPSTFFTWTEGKVWFQIGTLPL